MDLVGGDGARRLVSAQRGRRLVGCVYVCVCAGGGGLGLGARGLGGDKDNFF